MIEILNEKVTLQKIDRIEYLINDNKLLYESNCKEREVKQNLSDTNVQLQADLTRTRDGLALIFNEIEHIMDDELTTAESKIKEVTESLLSTKQETNQDPRSAGIDKIYSGLSDIQRSNHMPYDDSNNRHGMINTNKLILDACCGSRMFWFNKNNPDVLFADLRSETYDFLDGRKNLEVKPDIQMDFKNMPFANNTFQMVVFDPPHRTDLTSGNWMELYYGKLSKEWRNDIKAGINECMRVLKPNGTLIFKWNKHQIPTSKVIEAIDYKPLFGHTTGKTGNTVWMAFIKK